MKKWFFTISLVLNIIVIYAAGIEVVHFRANEEDLTALNEKRFDRQNRMCALIKVKSEILSLRFSGEPPVVYQSPNPESDGYYVFVSPQQNNLTLHVEGYPSSKYQTPILQSGRVYEMEVIANFTKIQDRKGSIYVKCTPQAEIFLNDSSYGGTPRIITGLTIGTYSIKLSAEGYKDYTNNNVVVEENVTTDVVATLYGLGGGGSSFASTAKPKTSKNSSESSREKKSKKSNGWFGGISLGMIKPNNYTANYYSGSKEDYNSLYYFFSKDYYQTRYDSISRAIGHAFDTTNIGTPADMAYNLSPNFGLYGGYAFDKKNRILLSFDYHHLKTRDVLMLYFITGTTFGNEVGTQCSIVGKEDRFNINLGYSREFTAGNYTTWYLMAGVNINNVVVQSNDIYVPIQNTNKTAQFNIMRTIYNPDGTTYNQYKGGVGYGIFGVLGFRLLFTENFSIDPEFQFFFAKSGISQYYKSFPEFKHYDKFKGSFQLSIRINLFSSWAKRQKNAYDDE
ncbi:MAG: PEGA domain-containing protein [Bacteroidales bacterium]|jgi:hypothetical protein|nr:PEGA domain-containing protein [Bacteroidales bacterium]